MSAEQIPTTPTPTPAQLKRRLDVIRGGADEAQAAEPLTPEPVESVLPQTHEQTIDTASPATTGATQRKRSTRPQGAPDYGTSTGEIIVSGENTVELPEAAKPTSSQRSRGGASRGAGPSNTELATRELARQVRLQRLHLPSRFLEKAGVDADKFIRDSALSAMRRAGWNTSPLEPKKPAPAKPEPAAAPEPAANKPTKRTSGKLELTDLVKVSANGRAYVTGSRNSEKHSRNGQLLSEHEVGLLKTHEAQIRLGLRKLAAERGLITLDSLGRPHRSNGQIMTNKELIALLSSVPYVGEAAKPEPAPASGAQSGTTEPEGPEATPTEPEEAEPAEPVNVRQRAKRLLAWAKNELYTLPQTVMNTIQTATSRPSEELSAREINDARRRIALTVIGGIAVVGAVTAAHKLGMHNNGLSGSGAHEAAHGLGQGGSGTADQQTLKELAGSKSGKLTDKQILDQLVAARAKHSGHGKKLTDQQILQSLINAQSHAEGAKHGLELAVHRGDMPWDVLHRAGVPESDIMHHLDQAARESGLKYSWHGSGEHRWLEVAGKSDTRSVIKLLGQYIKR